MDEQPRDLQLPNQHPSNQQPPDDRPARPEELAVVQGRRMPLASARLPLTDEGVARGDGAFETVGVWGGRAFRLDDHLARLQASLAAIALPPADLDLLRQEASALLDGVRGDAALRLYVTGSGTRVLTLSGQPGRAPVRTLQPRFAPWIRPPADYEPAGAKTMSYGPNMTATRLAQAAGADDALLVSAEGHVLEGPTFGVLWVAGGDLCSAPVSAGIVDSISRRTLLALAAEQGLRVRERLAPLDELGAAEEVLVCSSVRDVTAIARVGAFTFPGSTPARDALSRALEAARRGR